MCQQQNGTANAGVRLLQLHIANSGGFFHSVCNERWVYGLARKLLNLLQPKNLSGTTHASEKGPSFTEVRRKDEVESGLQIPFAFVSAKKSDPVQRGVGYRPRQSIPHQRTCGTACQPGTQNFPI